ncbi:HAP5 [Candida metapsilosis]|uniref:HAP5 n=1 Tax=Candida metapsilosis TaxID=273372 RepID=A0A8H8D950_9ASCO|nr:HAP5 [Candida metapsilosis]
MDTYEETNYIDGGQVARYDEEQPSLEDSTHIPPHISNHEALEGSLHQHHQQFEGDDAQISQEGEYEEEDIVPSHQTIVDESELLAAQAAAEAAAAAQQQEPGDVFNNVGQGLEGPHRDMMMQYWQETINSIEHDEHDFKNHQLPLARIKKVMKTDEDVRMISAEAPILFAKGCDVFITELTMRAWIHAEENKRRTLQKSDIAAALTKSDMFDFLIDVVPREEEKSSK